MKFSVTRSLIAAMALATSLGAEAPAQTTLAGQAAMKFLNVGIGARAAGMGYSVVTATDDIGTVFWNPAGIANLSGTRAFVDVNSWIADIKQISFAASQNLGNFGTVALQFTIMDYGDIAGTAIELSAANSGSFEYVETGPVKVTNYAAGITYARAISTRFSVGGTVKYVYSGLGSNTIIQSGGQETIDNTASTLAFDFGTTLHTGFRDLSFSMSLRNFSKEIRYPRMTQGFYLPVVFTLGFSIDAITLIDPAETTHSLVIAINGQHPTDYLEKASIGAEYSFDHQWFLRAGYKLNYSIEGLSFGLGARIPFAGAEMLQFDYGYCIMKYFDGVHRISLGVVL
jgi:hypothetical protein